MAQITPKLNKRLGGKRDKPDLRDLEVMIAGVRGSDQVLELRDRGPYIHASGSGIPLPSMTDVFQGLNLPVYDQAELGSCTANAGVLYRRFLAQRFAKHSAPDQKLSRLFLYYQERKLEGTMAEDAGASARDIFKVLMNTGVCPAWIDPYSIGLFASAAQNDSPNDLEAARAYRIRAYHRVTNADAARSVLASGYAIALGFTVYASFEDISGDGVMTMPRPDEQVIGRHAVVIRGYDDLRQMFFLQNSWGLGWGSGGCFWMPYAFLQGGSAYFGAPNLSQFDMWMGSLKNTYPSFTLS